VPESGPGNGKRWGARTCAVSQLLCCLRVYPVAPAVACFGIPATAPDPWVCACAYTLVRACANTVLFDPWWVRVCPFGGACAGTPATALDSLSECLPIGNPLSCAPWRGRDLVRGAVPWVHDSGANAVKL